MFKFVDVNNINYVLYKFLLNVFLSKQIKLFGIMQAPVVLCSLKKEGYERTMQGRFPAYFVDFQPFLDNYS
jgi:hypothetical protein